MCVIKVYINTTGNIEARLFKLKVKINVDITNQYSSIIS